MGRADADKYIIKENGVPYLNWKRINADIKKHPDVSCRTLVRGILTIPCAYLPN